MKILQVNCVYNKGSTGKIVYDIHTELQKQGITSVVCYGRGAKTTDVNVYKTCSELYSKFNNLLSRFTGIMYGGCFFSTNKLISIIKKEQPDIVHLHCINGYFVNIYRLITWLKRHRIKTVLTLHAEFMHTANCSHSLDCEQWKTGCKNCSRWKQETKSLLFNGTARSWKKMKKALDGFEKDCIVTSVSPWLMGRAKQSPILRNFRHETVLNGLDTENTFYPHDAQRIRNILGIGDKKMVLHVTASFSLDPTHIKGGYYVAALAKRMPDCVFVIVGSRDTSLSLPDNIINIGRIENQHELAAYYSAADVTLLTSKKETFSMVTAESLCCGTPVAGFCAGAPETIALPQYSSFADFGDLNALEKAATRMCNSKPIDTAAAQNAYSKQTMSSNYLRLYTFLASKWR